MASPRLKTCSVVRRQQFHGLVFALLLVCLLSILTPRALADDSAGQPVAKGQRIYASHHSYYLPIPPILAEIAASGGYPDQVFVGSDYIGGSKAIQHWNIPDASNNAKAALVAGKTDVLILTPVYLPDDGIEKFARLGLEHNPEIRVTAMEFWLPFDVYNPTIYDPGYKPVAGEPPLTPKPDKVDHNAATPDSLRRMHEYYFQTMDAHIEDLNKRLGKRVIYVVPMGQAVLALREKIVAGQAPGLTSQAELFVDDLGHPGPVMEALEAYCHYTVIYRKSPVGLPVPTVLKESAIAPLQLDALNRLLQQLAWDAAIHHPLSGVR